jgi:AcrR family transcriptional regulator
MQDSRVGFGAGASPRREINVSEVSSDTAAPVARRGAGATRERILEGATAMFYANGIRGTSADRIIERVGITRVTFYRHFPTKTDLAVAYLEAQAAQERAAIEQATGTQRGLDALLAIAGLIGTASCMPGFRGCPFINAAAETPDPEDPIRVVVERHREWTRALFVTHSDEAGVLNPDATGGQVMMLRDGAMVRGYLEDPQQVTDDLRQSVEAVVTAGRGAATAATTAATTQRDPAAD